MDNKAVGKEHFITLAAMAHVWATDQQPTNTDTLGSVYDAGSAVCLMVIVGAACYRYSVGGLERLDAAIRAERDRPGLLAETQALWRMVRR